VGDSTVFTFLSLQKSLNPKLTFWIFKKKKREEKCEGEKCT